MKLLKQKSPRPQPSPAETVDKKERIGRPMLFPIVFCLVSGLLLILLKDLTMRITGYVLAALLILGGAWQVFGYFRSESLVRIIESRLAVGLILLVTGSLLAFSPESLRDLLPYAWGLSLLFGGFLKIQYAVDRKALGSEKWWILLIMAAFSLLIGVVSLLNPAFLGDKRELVIGILLMVESVLDISVFLLLKRQVSRNTVTLPLADSPAAASEPPVPEAPAPVAETPVPEEPIREKPVQEGQDPEAAAPESSL